MHIIKPDSDVREYQAFQLESNDLSVLLVSDPATDKAAAAMDVNVGNFSDSVAGLAHFCEHLLFLGTQKYPGENEYSAFLSEHGGMSNAFTGTENTNYFFQVNKEHLDEALDRFAQFFISPLLNEDGVNREILAVDSEHKKNQQSDQWRLYQLLKDLSSPTHPFSKFGTGNVETLQTNHADIRATLLKFHAEYYSSNIMRLVVYGKEPISVLKQWVMSKFAAIPNLKIDRPRFAGHPMSSEQKGTIVRVKPVKDLRHVDIMFAFPDTIPHYRVQPQRYFAHLLGHESEGSIASLLKKKGWALSLSASNCYGSFDFDFFLITVELTEQEHYEDIVVTIFEYIGMMKLNGISEWIFQEIKTLREVDFRHKENQSQPINYVSRLAGDMHKYPAEHYVCGSALIWEYDEKLIAHFMTFLNLDNFRIVLVSPTFESSEWDKANYYGTEYQVSPIPTALMERLQKVMPNPELYLPKRNEFVPDNYDVSPVSESKDESPVMILDNDLVRLWFKKDDVFKVPKAIMRCEIKTPFNYLSPSHAVETDLFCLMVEDELIEESYYAELAGLRYHVYNSNEFISLKVEGYNSKLDVLLAKVLLKFKSLKLDAERFAGIKDQLKRNYKDWSLGSPHEHASYYVTYALQDKLWHSDEKLANLDEIDVASMVRFVYDLFKETHVEVFVHGNACEAQALKLADMIVTGLDSKALPKLLRFPKSRMLIVPSGHSYVYKHAVRDVNNVNSAMEYYLQVGSMDDMETRTKVSLFCDMIREECFDMLRTKEQLGYLVWSVAKMRVGIVGIRFIIQSEREPWYLEQRVNAFLEHFSNSLQNMSDSAFGAFKQARLQTLQESDKNLSQANARYWGHLSSHYYDFNIRQKEIALLNDITLAEMQDFYKTKIAPCGRFCTWIKSIKKWEDAWPSDERSYVEDIDAFKNSLTMSKGAFKVL